MQLVHTEFGFSAESHRVLRRLHPSHALLRDGWTGEDAADVLCIGVDGSSNAIFRFPSRTASLLEVCNCPRRLLDCLGGGMSGPQKK